MKRGDLQEGKVEGRVSAVSLEVLQSPRWQRK